MLRSEEYMNDVREISGKQVKVTSYKIGEVFYCHVANIDPDATIARAHSDCREEAEKRALDQARERLGLTQK